MRISWADGTQIVAGGQDGILYFYDAKTHALIKTLHGQTGFIGALAWSPEGTRLASLSFDGTVKVWNLVTGTVLAAYPSNPTIWLSGLVWSPDGRWLAYGGLGTHINKILAPSIPEH